MYSFLFSYLFFRYVILEIIKSISYSQDEIIKNIINLHCNGKLDCDVTYGNGAFYKEVEKPKYKYDIEALSDGVKVCCSTDIPLKDNHINSLMFDPPFLTYVREGREHGSKKGKKAIMSSRFGGYWTYKQLTLHYRKTIDEAYRCLNKKGIFIIKCQDIIHNHKMHCTHYNVIKWAEDLFRLKDMFILTAKNRINRKVKQQHARIYHSYFLVFESLK